jgi:hypothetical protein
MPADYLEYISPACAAFSLMVAVFVAYVEWLRPVRIRPSWFAWRDSQGIRIWLNMWNSGPVPTNVVMVRFRVGGQYLPSSTRGFLDSIPPGATRTVEFAIRDHQSADTIVFSAEIVYTARSGFKRWRKEKVIAPVWKEDSNG